MPVNPRPLVLAAALAALTAVRAAAQADTAAVAPLEDNSFLVEEAYNQGAGVVQHVSTVVRGRGGQWEYAFEQEWPLGGQRHQLSYEVPLLAGGGHAGLGDISLSYRYQLAGLGDAVAVAPRLSVIVPTGDVATEAGAGGVGVEGALPVSWVVVPNRLVTHTNVGVAWVPRARDPLGNRAGTAGVFVGQSVVWLARPMFNLMLEAVWGRHQAVTGPDATTWESHVTLSPGVRFGVNLPGDLQVVPGIAVPFGIGPSSGERALFLYLSLEHPFTR